MSWWVFQSYDNEDKITTALWMYYYHFIINMSDAAFVYFSVRNYHKNRLAWKIEINSITHNDGICHSIAKFHESRIQMEWKKNIHYFYHMVSDIFTTSWKVQCMSCNENVFENIYKKLDFQICGVIVYIVNQLKGIPNESN